MKTDLLSTFSFLILLHLHCAIGGGAISKTDASCSSGWLPFCPLGEQGYCGCHCYKLFPHASWPAARENCVRVEHADLASIQSAEENHFLDVMRNRSESTFLWLGMHRVYGLSINAFAWADGSPTTYTNWDSQQPSNWGGAEDCMNMQYLEMTGKWNDAPCSEIMPYICKKKAIPN